MAGWRYSGRGPVLLAAGGPGCKNRTSMPAVAAAVTLLAATASVAVLAFSVAPADSSFFLKQVGHGTGGHGVGARPSRQTELSNVFTAPMEPCHKYLSCAVSLRFGSVGPVLGFTSGFPSDLRELDGGFEGLGLRFRV